MNIKPKLDSFAGWFVIFIGELHLFCEFVSGQGAYEVYGLNGGNNYDTSYSSDQYPVGYDLGRSIDTMAPPPNVPSWLTVPQSLAGYPIYMPQQVIYASYGSSYPVQNWGDYKWNNFYNPTIITEPKNDSLYDNFEDYVNGRWTPPPPTVPTVATTVATITRAAAVAAALLPTATVAPAAANQTHIINTTTSSPAAVAASAVGLSSLLKTNATVPVPDPPKTINATILASALSKLGDILIRPATAVTNKPAAVPGSEATTVAAGNTSSTETPFPSADEISAAAAKQVSAGEVITGSPNADMLEDETEAPSQPAETPSSVTALPTPTQPPVTLASTIQTSATHAPTTAAASTPAGTNLTAEVSNQVQTAVQSAVASALPQSITNPLISPSGSPFLIQTPPPLISAAGVGDQLATEAPGKALIAAHPEAANLIKEIIAKANATAQKLISTNETAGNRTAREHPDDLRSLVLDLLETLVHSSDVPAVNTLRRLLGRNSPPPITKKLNATFEDRASTTPRKRNRTMSSSSTTKMPPAAITTSRTTVKRPVTHGQTTKVISAVQIPSLPANGTGQMEDRESRAFSTNLRTLMASLLQQIRQGDTQSSVSGTKKGSANNRIPATLSTAVHEILSTKSHVEQAQFPAVTSASTTTKTHPPNSSFRTTNSITATIFRREPASSTLIEQSTPTESPIRATTAPTALFHSIPSVRPRMALPPLRSQLNLFGISKNITRQIRQFRDPVLPTETTVSLESITRPSRKRVTTATSSAEESTVPTAAMKAMPSSKFVKQSAALDKQDLWKLLGIFIDPVPLPNIDHSALRASEIRKTTIRLNSSANQTAMDRTTQASNILDITLPMSTPKRGICAPYEDQGAFGICVDKTEVFSACDGMVIKKAKFCEASAVCCVPSL